MKDEIRCSRRPCFVTDVVLPTCEGGIYYQDDHVTLYHGDFLEVARKILPCKAVITDPPFAMAGAISNGRGSETSDQFFRYWWKAVAREMVRIIEADGAGFIHCDWKTAGGVAAGFNVSQQDCAPLRVRQMLYWNRQMIGQGRPFRNQIEMIAFVRGGKFDDSHIPKHTSNVIEAHWYYGKHKHHPAQKSAVVTKQLIQWANPQGGMVLDPFAGGGTTLVVCNKDEDKSDWCRKGRTSL